MSCRGATPDDVIPAHDAETTRQLAYDNQRKQPPCGNQRQVQRASLSERRLYMEGIRFVSFRVGAREGMSH